MAALNRPTEANYEVHENVRVDTQDNEDHTFCGIMFPIKAKQDIPVSQILVHSVAVRGQLGNLTVWVSKANVTATTAAAAENTNPQQSQWRFPLQKRYWTQIYQNRHAPSQHAYQWLDFSANPIVLQPGQVRAIYIHSTLDSDQAIVYDNAAVRPWHYAAAARHRRMPQLQPRYQDAFVSVWPGKAHLSPEPFGQSPIWGWGNAWRDHREFVGQLRYGVRYQLWQPALTTTRYGPEFRAAVQALLACQRRLESPVARLPDECLYYILNMCRWDWWSDTATALKEQRRRRKQRQRAAAAAATATASAQLPEQQTAVETMDTTATAAVATSDSAPANCEHHVMEESHHEASVDIEMQDDEDGEDDDDEEWQEEEEEDVADDSDSDASAWERQHGYRANTNVFIYHDVSSDEESDNEDGDPAAAAAERQAWFRRHFARIHILRALAQADDDDQGQVVMHVDRADDSSQDAQDGDYVPLEDTDEEG